MNLDQGSMVIRSVWETFWRQEKDGQSFELWASTGFWRCPSAWGARRVPTACEGLADGGTDPETWGGTSSQGQAGLWVYLEEEQEEEGDREIRGHGPTCPSEVMNVPKGGHGEGGQGSSHWAGDLWATIGAKWEQTLSLSGRRGFQAEGTSCTRVLGLEVPSVLEEQ